MSGYNNNYQPENRSWTQPDPRSHSFAGVTPTHPWTTPTQFDHEPRVVDQDMQEEPERYQSPESNIFHSHNGILNANQPLRSASESNAGQLARRYESTMDEAQIQARVEARIAEMFAQGQHYANNPAGPLPRQNTTPMRPARQGNRYNGKLLVHGNANVLVGNLMDDNQGSFDPASHDFNFTETIARQNARLIMGDARTAQWHGLNQAQIRHSNGIYTAQPGVPPQPMPPQDPYQQNMHYGR